MNLNCLIPVFSISLPQKEIWSTWTLEQERSSLADDSNVIMTETRLAALFHEFGHFMQYTCQYNSIPHMKLNVGIIREEVKLKNALNRILKLKREFYSKDNILKEFKIDDDNGENIVLTGK